MDEVLNIWGFTEETNSETSSSKFMPAGIDTGRFITKIEYVGAEGKSYLQVDMEDSAGRTVSGRYYEPKIDGNIIKDAVGLKKKIDGFNKVVANLGRKFCGELYVCTGTSFANLCQNLIKDIGEKYVGKDLRTKVLLNAKGYPVLPSYVPIWEDPEVVVAADSKLVINSIDRIKVDEAKPDVDAVPATSWVTPASF